jgi:hypothetical protein
METISRILYLLLHLAITSNLVAVDGAVASYAYNVGVTEQYTIPDGTGSITFVAKG